MKRGVAAVALFIFAGVFAQGVTLYSSRFDNPPFDPVSGFWAGVDGWLATDPSNGSIGVTSDGGAVYVGGTAPAGTVAAAIKQFKYNPVGSGTPIVKIRARIAINDSSNNRYDIFAFGIYNSAGQLLGALGFDNVTLAPFYNDGVNEYVLPGLFVNNAYFDIKLTADFSTNRASATVRYPGASEVPLFTNRQFHGSGASLNLGDMEVVWIVNSSGTAGDNYLVMDSLSIEALAAPKLSIDKGYRHRVRGASHQLRGRQAAEDDVQVQVRVPGQRSWAVAKGSPQRWSFPVKKLEIGQNLVQVRLVDAVGHVIDRKKVVIIRK